MRLDGNTAGGVKNGRVPWGKSRFSRTRGKRITQLSEGVVPDRKKRAHLLKNVKEKG